MATKRINESFCVPTIENIVPRVHLTELGHVFDRVTTGRGGAYAGLTGDASILQSKVKQHFDVLVRSGPITPSCIRKSNSLSVCLTFPWTAESSRWFPGQLSVSAPLLCTCRCCHSEHTRPWAPRRPPERWPEQVWAPQGLNTGLQLQQRKQRISQTHMKMSCGVPELYLSHCHSRVSARHATAGRLLVASSWAPPERLGDPAKPGRDPVSLTELHSAPPMKKSHHNYVKRNDSNIPLDWYFDS